MSNTTAAQPAQAPKGQAIEIEDFHEEIFENLSEAQRKKYHVVLESLASKQYLTEKLQDASATVRGTMGERLADKVATFGGSWTFILWFAAVLIVWMGINALLLNDKGFDPYPFILLNLCLSCLAAIQAPVIMMSQNRKEQRDRRRAEDDYLTNLKAEIEVRKLHKMMSQVSTNQRQLVETTQQEQHELLETLHQEIASLKKTVEGLCQFMKVPRGEEGDGR